MIAPTPGARPARRASSVVAALAALAPRYGLLGLALAALLAGCRRGCPPGGQAFRRPPAFDGSVLVLAPHPDDEVLGAAGVMAETLRHGGRAAVIVATDGALGAKRERGPRLAATRQGETRRAMGRLGLGPGDVGFLGYADGGLAVAWDEQWRAARRDAGEVSATELVDALRGEIRSRAPRAVVLPMPLDRHPDHAALGRFAMLAVLGDSPPTGGPELLAYLVHGGPGWPAHHGDGCGVMPRPQGCSGEYPWLSFPLDAGTQALEAALIREYRSQLGHGPDLLRFATANELLTSGVVVRANRAMAPARAGVHRTATRIAIDIPRTACGLDAGARLRLRFFRANQIEERLVAPAGVPAVLAGQPGGALVATDDVRVVLAPRAVRLRLAATTFGEATGAVVDIVPERRGRVIPPTWLLRW